MKRSGMKQFEEDGLKTFQEDGGQDMDDSLKTVTERDKIIHDYQLQEMMRFKSAQHKLGMEGLELLKLLNNYNYLKKLFIALAVLNIILILCVVTIIPVILVSFNLSINHAAKSDDDIKNIASEQLSSTEGKTKIRLAVFCVACSSLDQKWSNFFSDSKDEECCIEDIAAVFDMISTSNEQSREDCYSRVNELDVKQRESQFDIGALQMAVFNTSEVEQKQRWPKHPGIQKNNELINTLLARRRSAIHLYGKVEGGGMKWTTEMSEGKISFDDYGISVESGGMYFVYSAIRYKKYSCASGRIIGYEVKLKGSLGSPVTIASVQNHCLNGTSFDQDFIIQKVFRTPVGQNSIVFIDVGKLSHSLIVKKYKHYIGIFEI